MSHSVLFQIDAAPLVLELQAVLEKMELKLWRQQLNRRIWAPQHMLRHAGMEHVAHGVPTAISNKAQELEQRYRKIQEAREKQLQLSAGSSIHHRVRLNQAQLQLLIPWSVQLLQLGTVQRIHRRMDDLQSKLPFESSSCYSTAPQLHSSAIAIWIFYLLANMPWAVLIFTPCFALCRVPCAFTVIAYMGGAFRYPENGFM